MAHASRSFRFALESLDKLVVEHELRDYDFDGDRAICA